MEVANTLTGTVLVDSRSEQIQNRYELAELLGAGGSGSTYRAIPLGATSSAEQQPPVAIKILSLQHLQDWKQLELFEREAKVLSQLHHPQIPQYLDYFHIDTPENRAFYIVQQLAPGKPLTAWVQSGWRATEAELQDIVQQLLEILQYLHQQSPSLIHRDIKPHNIIRNDDGRVFLVDFGAVQNVYQNTLLKGSTVAGTYGYMSPEQFRGAAVPGSDLYGLGATVLFLLTHRSPADLPQERLKLKFRDHVNISEHFADWLEIMMEPNVVDRFPNAKQASIALAKEGQLKSLCQTQNKSLWKISISLLTVVFFIYQFRYVLLMSVGIRPNDFCSKNMNIATIDEYIRTGGNPNVQMNDPFFVEILGGMQGGSTRMLNCAIKFNKIEVVRYLLDHGAEPNLFDYSFGRHFRNTALHEAISGDEAMIRMLLDRGANPNITDESGNTPLHYLLCSYQLVGECHHPQNISNKIFSLFIEYNADPRLANSDGNTVLHIVAYRRIANEYSSNTIYTETNEKYSSLYSYLVELGWDPLQKNNKGETAQQLMTLSKSPV